MPLWRHLPPSICQIVSCMGGCLGCFTKPPLGISVDDSSKGQQIQGQAVKKRFIAVDSWSTSHCEMDNSVAPSQRSIYSISTLNQTLDPPDSGAGEPSNPSEFVNRGLLLWNQTRQQWTANKGTQNRTQVREPKISWNATYDSLLGNSKPFRQPIPLAEMIDFLVDVWEQEGLYD
ncbi:uncharacterized protein LOC115686161 isoform X2 [Syzygium oleosum]|uniref:uncharacterized protein LOC115686161 isoform X2 n=1 Tax=Syzygium oleosum TaxID=219896 RepID=UPI0011D2AF4B|nr:uncharacterized protein LOC115686161 isoform X2 [Syzygium oleosum]XP_056174679.1 uncharacterized protein LOC115686161 isoform X2 [Syzygium oleosum]